MAKGAVSLRQRCSSSTHTAAATADDDIESGRAVPNGVESASRARLLKLKNKGLSHIRQRRRMRRRMHGRRYRRALLYVLGFIGSVCAILVFMRGRRPIGSIPGPSFIERIRNRRATARKVVYDFKCRNDPSRRGVLNDNYCDCEDGSDEPGTSACSGLLVGERIFRCRDEADTRIFASRVGDGRVDCPNGADEVDKDKMNRTSRQ